jgi:shikimate kinase
VDSVTRELIKAKAVSVWLKTDLEVLARRIGRKDNRPLLKNGDPREILTRLRDERRPAYSQAPIHVMSTSGPHRHTVEQVLRGLDEWL